MPALPFDPALVPKDQYRDLPTPTRRNSPRNLQRKALRLVLPVISSINLAIGSINGLQSLDATNTRNNCIEGVSKFNYNFSIDREAALQRCQTQGKDGGGPVSDPLIAGISSGAAAVVVDRRYFKNPNISAHLRNAAKYIFGPGPTKMSR